MIQKVVVVVVGVSKIKTKTRLPIFGWFKFFMIVTSLESCWREEQLNVINMSRCIVKQKLGTILQHKHGTGSKIQLDFVIVIVNRVVPFQWKLALSAIHYWSLKKKAESSPLNGMEVSCIFNSATVGRLCSWAVSTYCFPRSALTSVAVASERVRETRCDFGPQGNTFGTA